jgi:hypothetical protein
MRETDEWEIYNILAVFSQAVLIFARALIVGPCAVSAAAGRVTSAHLRQRAPRHRQKCHVAGPHADTWRTRQGGAVDRVGGVGGGGYSR